MWVIRVEGCGYYAGLTPQGHIAWQPDQLGARKFSTKTQGQTEVFRLLRLGHRPMGWAVVIRFTK